MLLGNDAASLNLYSLIHIRNKGPLGSGNPRTRGEVRFRKILVLRQEDVCTFQVPQIDFPTLPASVFDLHLKPSPAFDYLRYII